MSGSFFLSLRSKPLESYSPAAISMLLLLAARRHPGLAAFLRLLLFCRCAPNRLRAILLPRYRCSCCSPLGATRASRHSLGSCFLSLRSKPLESYSPAATSMLLLLAARRHPGLAAFPRLLFLSLRSNPLKSRVLLRYQCSYCSPLGTTRASRRKNLKIE